jgi:hypothetical protein
MPFALVSRYGCDRDRLYSDYNTSTLSSDRQSSMAKKNSYDFDAPFLQVTTTSVASPPATTDIPVGNTSSASDADAATAQSLKKGNRPYGYLWKCGESTNHFQIVLLLARPSNVTKRTPLLGKKYGSNLGMLNWSKTSRLF